MLHYQFKDSSAASACLNLWPPLILVTQLSVSLQYVSILWKAYSYNSDPKMNYHFDNQNPVIAPSYLLSFHNWQNVSPILHIAVKSVATLKILPVKPKITFYTFKAFI